MTDLAVLPLDSGGLVPLDGLALPRHLSGERGRNRASGLPQVAADDDRSAVLAWLERYQDSPATFRHIDRLFSDVVDWKLIRDHWRDLMQVSISIQAGKIASPMLLRKLSQEGRHNRLFAAARELGRVLRTVYLLRWISSKEMRQEVSATTNKIESYHAFTKWLDFGGDVINENDPNEQQKRVRFIDLVASSVILQNTVDMMRVLQEMYADGEPVSAADVEYLSPYMTSGIKRFGNYHLDLKRPPEPWVKESQFREAAKRARAAAAAVAAEGQRAGQKGAGA